MQAIAYPVIRNCERQEPRIAVVKRTGFEFQIVEGGGAFGFAEKLLCKPGSKIGRERNAGTTIAQAVMEPVRPTPEMRERVKGIGDGTAPAVGDLR